MTDNPTLQLSLQRANQLRDADLADKLERSIAIIEQRKRKPHTAWTAEELLAERAAINTELADRKERNAVEHARLAKEMATLARAGISRPRRTRKDKGIVRTARGIINPVVPKDL